MQIRWTRKSLITAKLVKCHNKSLNEDEWEHYFRVRPHHEDICSRLRLHSKAENRRKKFFQWNEKHRNKMGPERFKEEKRASYNQSIPSCIRRRRGKRGGRAMLRNKDLILKELRSY